jgi:hypothetical protein
MLRRDGIRQLVKEHGPDGYLKLQAQMLGHDEKGRIPKGPDGKAQLRESIRLPNGRKIPRKRPREFSIKVMWEAFVGPVEETLPGLMAADQVGLVEIGHQFREAINTGLFPTAVGQLIATEVIEAYDQTDGFIGDDLVRPMQSRLRGEPIPGFTAAQGPKEVVEGEDYQEATFAEKTVGTRETKRGRIISVTEEAVFFDQTDQVLDRAQMIGEAAREDRELRIVRGVIDYDSGDAIYAPGGTAAQLYSAGNNNLLSTATPLVDWTDIQEVLAFHALNVTDDREPDEENAAEPITWRPKILLTAVELGGVAARIRRACARCRVRSSTRRRAATSGTTRLIGCSVTSRSSSATRSSGRSRRSARRR